MSFAWRTLSEPSCSFVSWRRSLVASRTDRAWSGALELAAFAVSER
jgi:hypothetical protein